MAQSSISSASFSEGVITINGSGFGTKSPAAPVLWDRLTNISAYDDYELSTGDTIPVSREYATGGGPGGCTDCPWRDNGSNYGSITTYDTDNPRVSGGASYHAAPHGMLRDCGTTNADEFLYISWWLHTNAVFTSNSATKFFRWGYDGGYHYEDGLGAWQYNRIFPGQIEYDPYANWAGLPDIWNHLEAELDFRMLDVDSTGHEVFRTNSSTILDVDVGEGAYEDDLEELLSGPMTYIHLIGLDPSYPENIPDQITRWTDIYIDTSPKRVVLGNASTFDDCTVYEVLIPTTWSNTKITADVVYGDYEEGDDAWVYVLSTVDTVSAGYYIEIDSGGGSSAVEIRSASRTNNTLTVSITPPSVSPDYYIIWVAEDDVWRIGYTGFDTSASIIVDDTAVLRLYVISKDSDGSTTTSLETRIVAE